MNTGSFMRGKVFCPLVVSLAIFGVSILAPGRTEAAPVECFIKLSGIDGDSLVDRHLNEIYVMTWAFGESVPASLAGTLSRTATSVQMQDLKFTTRTGKHSTRVFQMGASGQHIRDGVFSCKKLGDTRFDYLRIILQDIRVSGYRIETPTNVGSPPMPMADNHPVDLVSLSFSRIKIEYTPMKPDGSGDAVMTGGWDLTTNRPWQ